MFETMGFTFSYISLWEKHDTDWKLSLNEYSPCACLVYLTWILFLISGWNAELNVFHKVVMKICLLPSSTLTHPAPPAPPPPPTSPPAPRPKMPFDGDISLIYLRHTYMYGLGKGRGHIFITHSILHFNRYWETEFKSDIPLFAQTVFI